jgi:hypothetical protein
MPRRMLICRVQQLGLSSTAVDPSGPSSVLVIATARFFLPLSIEAEVRVTQACERTP